MNAERGLAYSTSERGIDFLEIFPPTTLEEYVTRIHRRPKFTR